MQANTLLALVAAVTCFGLSTFALVWGRKSFANRVFAAGMLALGLHEVVLVLADGAITSQDMVKWQRMRVVLEAIIPGLWLSFSVTFARANAGEWLRKWRIPIALSLGLPLALASFGSGFIFSEAVVDEASQWVLSLAPAGYALRVLLLLVSVLILMNLESTLRGSRGTARWQIKFTLLGLGVYFAVHVYTNSQMLLYSTYAGSLSTITSAALLVSNVLIGVSSVRSRITPASVYLSQSLLHGSLTVLLVGVYLLAVGGLAKLTTVVGGQWSLPLTAFLVLASLVGLTILLLSNEAQLRFRSFVNRHLQRPKYDYRKVWNRFTERTGSTLETGPLCSAVATVVSETFDVPSVSIWLWYEGGQDLVLGGSTALSQERGENLIASTEGARMLRQAIEGRDMPVDLLGSDGGSSARAISVDEVFLREALIRYCVPLRFGKRVLGFLTLSDRVNQEPLSAEDFALLNTLADQAAANLLNLKLSEQLFQAKEMEAFQSLSAFFVHDLKNLASRLSLTMQNFRDFYDNPVFREDMFKVMSESLDKINSMCSRLSPLSRELEVNRTKTDLNQLISSTLEGLDPSIRGHITENLNPVPPLHIDPDLIQKVLVNLLLNAHEATDGHGEIRLETGRRDEWFCLSVSDNGCGMSRDFMAKSLFKPFHTTKKKGLGIGLFHSKKIVEAHGGRLEVQSEEDKGSEFLILLPS